MEGWTKLDYDECPLVDPRGSVVRRAVICLLVVALTFAGAVPVTLEAAQQEILCPDGTAPYGAQELETPLPSEAALSEGCDSFSTPSVSFLVGQDGQTYYLHIEQSTDCSAADDKLRMWVACWTFEPALCGTEPALQWVETEIVWSAAATITEEPPCDRGSFESSGGSSDGT